MDPIELNDSPDLSMDQITKLLFNNRFISDIEFRIENKVIYAHSWELIKRSVVFKNQLLTTLGEKKLIPIVDTTYEVFYQLIRFIYTDEYNVSTGAEIDLLKLARKYMVARLETKLLNLWIPPASGLDLLKLCTVDQYTLGQSHSRELVTNYLDLVLQCDHFKECHPKVVNEVLKLIEIPRTVKEIDIFEALVRWMNYSCEMNQIPLAQRRLNFDSFIRLIRFASIPPKDFDNCVKENRSLFTRNEIGRQFENLKARQLYKQPWQWREYQWDCTWETKFTVSRELILCGLRYGCGTKGAPHSIQIFARSLETDAVQSRIFRFHEDYSKFAYITRSLGHSILVRPNYEYTLEFKYLENSERIDVYTRQVNVDILINGVDNADVQILQFSGNLFELIFEEPAK